MAPETALARSMVIHKFEVCPVRETEISEKEALEAVKQGQKEAYQTIVARYMRSAYSIALGFVHNHQDALDISQEAFIRAFRKIKRFDTQKPFFPWFYKLMKNLCLDHIRKRTRLKEIPLEGLQIPGQAAEDRELREILWRAIEKLSLEQKEVIILRYFRQMSYQEIAETTGKPVGTVMSSLHYAKKKMREFVGPYLGLGK